MGSLGQTAGNANTPFGTKHFALRDGCVQKSFISRASEKLYSGNLAL